MNCVLNGTLRAAGRQALGARLHLMMYWGLGLPTAYVLGVKAGWGLTGFVAAIGATSFAQSLLVAFIISRWGGAHLPPGPGACAGQRLLPLGGRAGRKGAAARARDEWEGAAYRRCARRPGPWHGARQAKIAAAPA